VNRLNQKNANISGGPSHVWSDRDRTFNLMVSRYIQCFHFGYSTFSNCIYWFETSMAYMHK